jgi:hypothetical protein
MIETLMMLFVAFSLLALTVNLLLLLLLSHVSRSVDFRMIFEHTGRLFVLAGLLGLMDAVIAVFLAGSWLAIAPALMVHVFVLRALFPDVLSYPHAAIVGVIYRLLEFAGIWAFLHYTGIGSP